MELGKRYERLIQDKLGEIKDLVRELAQTEDYTQTNYERCYEDIKLLGIALGHDPIARSESASVVMREYIREVAELTGRKVKFPSWDEPTS